MQGLINDLLAFSGVGRLLTDHGSVGLEEVLGRTQDSLGLAIEESHAVITHYELPTVQGARTQLGMLFQNLIANAIKFRYPERQLVIHLSARHIDGVWEFAVSDNGIGIEAEYAERDLRRSSSACTPGSSTAATALCRKIVGYHGGKIAIDPDHTPGTRVVSP